jgi:hypothetical protein
MTNRDRNRSNLENRNQPVDGHEQWATRRGWHGMTARQQPRYTREDWKVYYELGAGNFVIVDVADHSPAWCAGIRNGAWVLEIEREAFEVFERCGAPVGTSVNVKTLHAARGCLEAVLVLAEPPNKDQAAAEQRRPHLRRCASGQTVHRAGRPKWEATLAVSRVKHSTVRIGTFLSNVAFNDNGSTTDWSYARLAARLHCDRSTIRRGLRQLCEGGFISIDSGQRARRSNRITQTWPVELTEVVVPIVIPGGPLRDGESA